MKKKSSQTLSDQDLSDALPKFLDAQSRVFTLNKGQMYIGRDLITPQLRSLLRDEAKNLQTTRLWEILNASVINEAYMLALNQSTDFDSVRFAKALAHWSTFMMNTIHLLSKEG